MRAYELRTILLIQAVEESDTKGELLPLAERDAVTRQVLREAGAASEFFAGDGLSDVGERMLVRRSRELQARLSLRAPIIDRLLAESVGAGRRDGLLVLALAVGFVLAALNGRSYIDILGLALLGILAWNLGVYALRIANLAAPRSLSGAGVTRLYARWLSGRAAALLRRSRDFNAPLASALPRFTKEWGKLARALVMQRAIRLFHVCAAIVALGMIAGLAVRGFVLRDVAAWSSSLFGAGIVRALIWIVYAPAAALSGIALPASSAAVESLRIAGASGAGASPAWIILIALTLSIYIIVPRVLAATVASFRIWHSTRAMQIPAVVLPYARRTLVASDTVVSVDGVQPPVNVESGSAASTDKSDA
jgi:hypothetical protein